MKYFNYLNNDFNAKLESLKESIFYKNPINLCKDTEFEILKYSLGAFLYIPAIQEKMLNSVLDGKIKGLCTFAICLEDSVGENGEKEAIDNLENFLRLLSEKIEKGEILKEDLPFVFIRPKNESNFSKILPIIKQYKELLMGVIIAKATSEKLNSFANMLDNSKLSDLYLLPIIETPEFIQAQYKEEAFTKMAFVINKHKSKILNIRIGVTDILGHYGIRREQSLSIYDSVIYKSFLSDVVGYLKDLEIPISGGVSEFFNTDNEEILNSLEKELLMDRLNGLIGKTVIHPKQLILVQLFNVVSYEDYMDATAILSNVDNKFGALGSLNSNRMNEVKPHYKWAKKIMILSSIYGVYNEGITFKDALKQISKIDF